MKLLLLVCAAFLFLALANLPIGYYSFLRILVTIGSLAVIFTHLEDGLNVWVIVFGLIAILFNPVFPVYLQDKSSWVPLDIAAGILFVVKSFSINYNSQPKKQPYE